MRALLPVFSTMLRFSPGDVARCQESAAKWEAAAGEPFEDVLGSVFNSNGRCLPCS